MDGVAVEGEFAPLPPRLAKVLPRRKIFRHFWTRFSDKMEGERETQPSAFWGVIEEESDVHKSVESDLDK